MRYFPANRSLFFHHNIVLSKNQNSYFDLYSIEFLTFVIMMSNLDIQIWKISRLVKNVRYLRSLNLMPGQEYIVTLTGLLFTSFLFDLISTGGIDLHFFSWYCKTNDCFLLSLMISRGTPIEIFRRLFTLKHCFLLLKVSFMYHGKSKKLPSK